MKYSELILDHFFNPRNVGCFSVNESRVCTGRIGTLNVSDVVQLQLKISRDGLIEQAKFKAYGNPYTIAALSWLTTQLIGQAHDESVQFDYRQIATAIGVPHSKMHAAVLVADVLRSAWQDYKLL